MPLCILVHLHDASHMRRFYVDGTSTFNMRLTLVYKLPYQAHEYESALDMFRAIYLCLYSKK